MQVPLLNEPRLVTAETWQLGSWLPVPGLGVLPANAFLIRARQPVLVDTGVAALRDPFLAAIGAIVDPSELRWRGWELREYHLIIHSV